MERGYWIHKLPKEIPTNYGFAFVLGMIGCKKDPYFEANWEKTIHIHRGIYQKPEVTATNGAFQHSSFLIELCQNHNPMWNDYPLVLNALQPNVDLGFIGTWVSQIQNELHPTRKPLIYITPKHWKEIQSGDNAEFVSKQILLDAELFISQYNVAKPDEVLYVDTLKWWEYENGKMQYAEDGKFEAVAVVTPPDEDTENPPTNATLTDLGAVRLECLKLAGTVWVVTSFPNTLDVKPIADIADKLLEYVNKKEAQ